MKLVNLLVILMLAISLVYCEESTEQKSDEMVADHRAEFDEYDLDKNGFITKEEIKKVVGEESDDKEINEFFEQVDTDKDNSISFEEYKEAVAKWEAEAG